MLSTASLLSKRIPMISACSAMRSATARSTALPCSSYAVPSRAARSWSVIRISTVAGVPPQSGSVPERSSRFTMASTAS